MMRRIKLFGQTVKGAEPVTMDLDGVKAKYKMESTSADTMEFEPLKLEKREMGASEHSRKILCATGIRNQHDPKNSLKIRLVYQKKHNKGMAVAGEEFLGLDRIKLSDLKAGQEIQVDLDTQQTAQLLEHLQNLYDISSEGIVRGVTEKAVVAGRDADFLEQVGADLQAAPERREQVLQLIRGLDPAAFDVAAHMARHEQHKTALQEFEEHLDKKDWKEDDDWDPFFRRNKWIFGHGLAYQFLSEIVSQPNYGGTDVSGKGAQRGDLLMATEANVRFTALVEIKTPEADLVGKRYRSGTHLMGEDVVGGVSQLQVNMRKWLTEGSKTEENRHLEHKGIYTVQPRGILVVGNTSSLDSIEKRSTFELYRQNLQQPDVVTFDELFERAKYLVEHDLPEQSGEVEQEQKLPEAAKK